MMKVIGLISGTSVDGIDAALIEISHNNGNLTVNLLNAQTYPYADGLRQQILAVCGGESRSIPQLAELDQAIAQSFVAAAQQIQGQHRAELIGSHGQTVFHLPPRANQLGYTLQLGRGEVIAHHTRIPTVSNFRVADIAAGGEGAPLVSKVDAYLLAHPSLSRAVQNIGGIGNVTYLPPQQSNNWLDKIYGWDTGPGNVLIDLAVEKLTKGGQTYDASGQWAAQGNPCRDLVQQWLQQDFFHQPPPKSTGRELFGQAYLDNCWQDAREYNLSDADWLATLTLFTASSIAHSYRQFLPQIPDEVVIAGGGSRNLYLRQLLQAELPTTKVITSDELGVDADFKEAIAFAVLAYWRYHSLIPGNLPQVTGAASAVFLGEIHPVYGRD